MQSSLKAGLTFGGLQQGKAGLPQALLVELWPSPFVPSVTPGWL